MSNAHPIPPDWRALIEAHGSPLAIYDVAYVRQQCRNLKAAFPFCDLYFALKANYSPALLQLILAEGFGVDAVSPNEVELALRCGAAADRIVYVENNMSDAEMALAVKHGVRLIVGSLSRLGKFAQTFPGASVGVRINADVGAAHHARAFTAGPESKFGIHHTQMDEAVSVAQAHGVRINLLHQHIGSGWLDGPTFLEAADILLAAAAKFPELDLIDFGGGFGVPYRDSDAPLDLPAVAADLKRHIDSFQKRAGKSFRFALEPGRYLVAESAALLATVQDKKQGADGRVFLGLDTGFNHLVRPALYGSEHRMLNLSRPEAAPKPYDVCGNICESTDFFARGVQLPEAQEGDVLAILNYGAYGSAMSSAYNLRPPVPEVFVDGDKRFLARERATLDQLLAGYRDLKLD